MVKAHNTIAQENFKYFYYSRNLPHLFDVNKPIFITYRLKFTLPKSIMEELNRQKTEWQSEYQKLADTEKQTTLQTKDETFFYWYDELLGKSKEVPQILHRPDLTKIITDSFHHFDNQRYELLAYCIMPNHVHTLIYPIIQPDGDIYPIAHITYTWKKFTAYQINKTLNQKGSLWQQESYDHLVKDENELYHILEYIMDNPVDAGLVTKWDEWQGTWIREDLKPSI
jgi:putative transposase